MAELAAWRTARGVVLNLRAVALSLPEAAYSAAMAARMAGG